MLDEIDQFDQDTAQIERHLGLPDNFYRKLVSEDDWSFVIKMNLLLEGICTHAVKIVFPEFEEKIALLPYGDKSYGKIELLQSVGIIDKGEHKALHKLAEIRNKCAHNIGFVNFTFDNYLAGLDKNQKKNFIEAFTSSGNSEFITIKGNKINRRELIAKSPKVLIWIVCTMICNFIYFNAMNREMLDKTKDALYSVSKNRR